MKKSLTILAAVLLLGLLAGCGSRSEKPVIYLYPEDCDEKPVICVAEWGGCEMG